VTTTWFEFKAFDKVERFHDARSSIALGVIDSDLHIHEVLERVAIDLKFRLSVQCYFTAQ
jgi:hypothetical protein